MGPCIEHIYSQINAVTVEQHLNLYRKAGFWVDKKTVRHPPGMRNGFVRIGAEYLEFLWIENQREYDEKKQGFHDEFLENPGPYGVAFDVEYINHFHNSLRRKNIDLPRMHSRGPADALPDDKPWWTFQHFNKHTLPGAFPFALQYHTRDYSTPKKCHVGKNKIFAISGLSFVCRSPERDSQKWAFIFGGIVRHNENDVAVLTLGPHILNWYTPGAYRRHFGKDCFIPKNKNYGHIRKLALIHTLSEDIKVSERCLVNAGWKVKKSGESLYVYPNKQDGFAFYITQLTKNEWRNERKRLGQKIVVS